MPQTALIQNLRQARIVPVVRTSTPEHAATAVAWLGAAGIRIFEITMTIALIACLCRNREPDAYGVTHRVTLLRHDGDFRSA